MQGEIKKEALSPIQVVSNNCMRRSGECVWDQQCLCGCGQVVYSIHYVIQQIGAHSASTQSLKHKVSDCLDDGEAVEVTLIDKIRVGR